MMDVFVDDTFVGSFTSHRQIRGYGGPILFSESHSLEAFSLKKFRNFKKKGNTFELMIIIFHLDNIFCLAPKRYLITNYI